MKRTHNEIETRIIKNKRKRIKFYSFVKRRRRKKEEDAAVVATYLLTN
jgi:hypothetical protein